MRLNQLSVRGRRHKKRLGRGNASGRGTYSGRGIKGQYARAGARIRSGFEGGQTRLFQRLAKRRGFRPQAGPAQAVNLRELERVFPAGTIIDLRSLKKSGVISGNVHDVKILGDGALTKSLTIALPISASAKKKVEEAGGTVMEEKKRVRGSRPS